MTAAGDTLRPIVDRLRATRREIARVLFEGERPVPAAMLEAALGVPAVGRLVDAGLGPGWPQVILHLRHGVTLLRSPRGRPVDPAAVGPADRRPAPSR